LSKPYSKTFCLTTGSLLMPNVFQSLGALGARATRFCLESPGCTP
jgi:hypothetical protein